MPRNMPRGGPQNMMRQLQQVQERMLAEQEALGDETVEVSVGGGVVTVVMNGHQKLTAVTIKPESTSRRRWPATGWVRSRAGWGCRRAWGCRCGDHIRSGRPAGRPDNRSWTAGG